MYLHEDDYYHISTMVLLSPNVKSLFWSSGKGLYRAESTGGIPQSSPESPIFPVRRPLCCPGVSGSWWLYTSPSAWRCTLSQSPPPQIGCRRTKIRDNHLTTATSRAPDTDRREDQGGLTTSNAIQHRPS